MERELTDKERMFCDEYLVDLNGTKSAVRAGYSENSAKSIAYELLGKPHIQETIQALKELRMERVRISQDQVLEELKIVGFSRMKKFADWDAGGIFLKSSEDLSDDDAACISELSETKTENGGSVKFKLHDKLKALELLGRHTGLWDKDGDPSAQAPALPIVMSPEQLAELIKVARGGQ